MNNRTQCFLAGVCCLYHVITSAQTVNPIPPTAADPAGDEILNSVPPILYESKPSVLVFIDGDPVITVDEELRLYRVVNTPYLLLKSHIDNKYYLHANNFWYVSDSATYGYTPLKVYPNLVKVVDSKLQKPAAPPAKVPLPPKIIICTQPTDLIQTIGPARFKTIPGTFLQYAENSSDYIFKDSVMQTIYVLLAGRWYQASALNGPWTYVPSNRLPADFAHIPEGSPKSGVLVHVAGTKAANLAVEIARKPITIKASRKKDTLIVTYDAGAEFSSIGNTGLFISENSNYPVINSKDKYYAIKNGVWFTSTEAMSSWEVSTERPPDLDKIPATHRAYNLQFAEITDTTADYVTITYTGGYTNTYVQHNTIVYGTGQPYRSWARGMYFPRPATWGWNMYYDAKTGTWKNRLAGSYYKDRRNLP